MNYEEEKVCDLTEAAHVVGVVSGIIILQAVKIIMELAGERLMTWVT